MGSNPLYSLGQPREAAHLVAKQLAKHGQGQGQGQAHLCQHLQAAAVSVTYIAN